MFILIPAVCFVCAIFIKSARIGKKVVSLRAIRRERKYMSDTVLTKGHIHKRKMSELKLITRKIQKRIKKKLEHLKKTE